MCCIEPGQVMTDSEIDGLLENLDGILQGIVFTDVLHIISDLYYFILVLSYRIICRLVNSCVTYYFRSRDGMRNK